MESDDDTDDYFESPKRKKQTNKRVYNYPKYLTDSINLGNDISCQVYIQHSLNYVY